MTGYHQDLAYIHDAGSSWFVLRAVPGLMAVLRRHGIRDGRVVDLGCGTGQWAHALTRAGYEALGIDQSAAMIRLARGRAPETTFRTGSAWTARLPPCRAVTAIGEVLNYRFLSGDLGRLFARVFRALDRGGVFVFDVAEPDRAPEGGPRRYWTAGHDWAVLVDVRGSRQRAALERRITTFRRIEGGYRRGLEIHRLRLFRADRVVRELERAGFTVRVLRRYGRMPLLEGQAAFVARKP